MKTTEKGGHLLMATRPAIAAMMIVGVAATTNTIVAETDIPWRTTLEKGEAGIVYRFQDAPTNLTRRPEGINVTPDGFIGVTDRRTDGTTYQQNLVGLISPETGLVDRARDLGPAETGSGGALGSANDGMGNGYIAMVAQNENHGVWKIKRSGETTLVSGSENIVFPNAITFDYEGNAYITDSYPAEPSGPGLVWRYEPGGTCEVWASSILLAPDPDIDPFGFPAPGANGIVFVPPDHIYVANNEKSLILDIPIMRDGSAGEIEIVAGAWPPAGPPGLLTAPDGLAADIEGNLYAAIPAAGGAPFPLSPVIKIYPATGDVEALVPPITEPSPLFDFPTSLTFGSPPLDDTSLFVISGTAGVTRGSGPAITQVGTGVTGAHSWSIQIPDSNLEAAFRAALQKPEGPILVAEMKALTSLVAPSMGITDLSGLELAPNLTTVDLSKNKITDIEALAGLTNLRDGDEKGLRLAGNYIDITPGSPARQIIDSLNAIEGLTVEFEPQNDPEPLLGGIPIGVEDWFGSDWFGYYGTAFAPWILHIEHGALYRHPESTNESMFVYDYAMGAWWWTSEDTYPYIYAYDPLVDYAGTDIDSAWLFYFEDSHLGQPGRVFGVLDGEDAGRFLFYGP